MLNQSEYKMLAIEVDDFTKDIEKLQNTNMSLENLIRQKQLKWEELEFKLQYYIQFEESKLESTKFINNEAKENDWQVYKAHSASPICTSINKLTFAVWEMLNDKQNKGSDEKCTNLGETYWLVYDVFKGKNININIFYRFVRYYKEMRSNHWRTRYQNLSTSKKFKL